MSSAPETGWRKGFISGCFYASARNLRMVSAAFCGAAPDTQFRKPTRWK
jgi:hypothetical protein